MQFHFLFHLAVFQVPASPGQSLLKHSENWVDLEDGFSVFFLCYFSFRLYYIALDNTLNIFSLFYTILENCFFFFFPFCCTVTVKFEIILLNIAAFRAE